MNRRQTSFNKLIILILSIIFGLIINYFITQDLISYVTIIPYYGYAVILLAQIIIIYYFFKYLIYSLTLADKYIISAIYLSYLLFIFFARSSANDLNIQLNPFYIIFNFEFNTQFILILFFNIISLIPLPLICQLLPIKTSYNKFIYVFIPILIELLQMILKRGIFDIDDIILYYIGILIGIILVKILLPKKTPFA